MRYGRDIDKETCRRFVLMYVNDYTMRLGDDGRAALRRLYEMAHAKKLIQAVLSIPSRQARLRPQYILTIS
jgi:1,4-dihydroxy-6-naphthoate synthase